MASAEGAGKGQDLSTEAGRYMTPAEAARQVSMARVGLREATTYGVGLYLRVMRQRGARGPIAIWLLHGRRLAVWSLLVGPRPYARRCRRLTIWRARSTATATLLSLES